MKTIKFILIFLCMSCYLLLSNSCKSNAEKQADTKSDAPEFIEQDFNATLIGTYKYVGPDTLPVPKCTDSLNAWRAIVDANGIEETLGDVYVYFDFCGDKESHYGNAFVYLVDKDSDTLFFDCAGQVIDGRLEEHPEFVTSYWKDTFYVLEGTGKFESASGEFVSDDYNSSEDANSHHNWKGTLKLIKQTND